jgi:hypothetical protein
VTALLVAAHLDVIEQRLLRDRVRLELLAELALDRGGGALHHGLCTGGDV